MFGFDSVIRWLAGRGAAGGGVALSAVATLASVLNLPCFSTIDSVLR